MTFVAPVLAFGILTLLSGCAWWFMSRRQKRWESLVEKENNFWRDKGLVSAAFAEKLKRWEKGRVLKAVAALSTLASAVGLALTICTLVKVIRLEHQPLRIPYNPALHQNPQPRNKRP